MTLIEQMNADKNTGKTHKQRDIFVEGAIPASFIAESIARGDFECVTEEGRRAAPKGFIGYSRKHTTNWSTHPMAVISYFPISLPEPARAGFEQSWMTRVGAVDTFPGFISTELVATEDRNQYVVLTRFTDKESFEAWINSDNFTRGHRGESLEKYKMEDNPFLKDHRLYEVLG